MVTRVLLPILALVAFFGGGLTLLVVLGADPVVSWRLTNAGLALIALTLHAQDTIGDWERIPARRLFTNLALCGLLLTACTGSVEAALADDPPKVTTALLTASLAWAAIANLGSRK